MLEYFDPARSVKDRIAKAMIEDAENKGLLESGSVIIVMPETMSVEIYSFLFIFMRIYK